jgi:diaminohydroxyphosphoribosylaminopyrimidine deaminase/5-amino-6-(5-phosphoribosylamino)uracil reductase
LLETVQAAPVVVFTHESAVNHLSDWRERGAEVVGLADIHVKSVLTELGRREMTNVLVEGGAETLGRFRDAGELDEIHAFVAPKLFGGTHALTPMGGLGVARLNEAWSLVEWHVERVGDDLLVHGIGKLPA